MTSRRARGGGTRVLAGLGSVNGDDTGVLCMEVSGVLRVDGKDFVERDGNQVYLLRPAR